MVQIPYILATVAAEVFPLIIRIMDLQHQHHLEETEHILVIAMAILAEQILAVVAEVGVLV